MVMGEPVGYPLEDSIGMELVPPIGYPIGGSIDMFIGLKIGNYFDTR